MNEYKNCRKCGELNREDMLACGKCGTLFDRKQKTLKIKELKR